MQKIWITMGSINQLPDQFQDLISNLVDNKEIDAASFVELYEFTKDEFFRNNPEFITSNWNWGTTQINDKAVEGELLPLQDSQTVIDEIINGNRLIVTLHFCQLILIIRMIRIKDEIIGIPTFVELR